MQRTYTRKEFYDLVWSKPMTKLAKDFGLSDVALHKLCRRHQIPTPPLGYWAKLAHGKPVVQTKLPKVAGGDSAPVMVSTGQPSQSAEAQEAKARAASLAQVAPAPAPQHKLITATLSKLRKAKANDRGLASAVAERLLDCSVAPSSIDRLEIILDRLVAAAGVQGFELTANGKSVKFAGPVESLSITISEEVKRSKHVTTAVEAAAVERLQNRRRRTNWDWDRDYQPMPLRPEWDYAPTGKLSIEFDQVYVAQGFAPRRSFRDGKSQSLENMAGEIAVGMVMLAKAKADERARREEQARLAEIEHQKRVERQRANYIEEKRSKAFDGFLERWSKLQTIRELVHHLQAIPEPRPERVEAMIKWAEDELDFRTSMLGPERLEARLEKDGVFGSDDDRGFYPSRW